MLRLQCPILALFLVFVIWCSINVFSADRDLLDGLGDGFKSASYTI